MPRRDHLLLRGSGVAEDGGSAEADGGTLEEEGGGGARVEEGGGARDRRRGGEPSLTLVVQNEILYLGWKLKIIIGRSKAERIDCSKWDKEKGRLG